MSIEITPNTEESLCLNASNELAIGIYMTVILGPVADFEVIDLVPRT